MSLILHIGSKRYSSWSLRPYLALAHAGAVFETRTIVLDRADSKANILKVNPAGRVPVLWLVARANFAAPANPAKARTAAPSATRWPVSLEKLAAFVHSCTARGGGTIAAAA